MTLSEQSVPPKSWTSDVTFSYITNQTFIPGGRPIGNKCFFIFRFADISFGFITLVSYDTPYSIPQTPWNKKTSNIEGVLKRKYFKRGVQQSNSPTRERILKCNSLLYSSIYFLFNHIYILQWRCLVGRCWTCWNAVFQPSNWLRPTKTAKNAACWTCWTSSNSIFFIVNLYN